MEETKHIKIAFIINPVSGPKRRKIKPKQIVSLLDKSRFDPLFFTTEYRGHASELARNAMDAGCRIVVAVGGDGTVNEVANTLVGTDITLGIIPFGSGNGLARHLKIPLLWQRAVNLLNKGVITQIDSGTLSSFRFFCTCGIGFDSRIGHKFKKVDKRGFLGYLKTILKEYRDYKPRKYTFTIDGEKFERRAFIITIANASQYGNNAFIAPKARINDGLFDVCIIKPFPRALGLSLGIRMFNRSIQNSKYHEVIRGKVVKFKKPKKKYIFHLDGEPAKFRKSKIVATVHPASLNVIVPARKKKSI